MPRRSERSAARRRHPVRSGWLTVLALACGATFAPSALAAPLTAERYAGLDSVYQAFESLDEDAKDLETALAPARQACAALDASDLLLGAARKQCRSFIKLLLLDDPSCPNRTRCLLQFREVRRLTEQVIADSRELNGAIENVVATKRCRVFLRTDRAEIVGFQRLVTA